MVQACGYCISTCDDVVFSYHVYLHALIYCLSTNVYLLDLFVYMRLLRIFVKMGWFAHVFFSRKFDYNTYVCFHGGLSVYVCL